MSWDSDELYCYAENFHKTLENAANKTESITK